MDRMEQIGLVLAVVNALAICIALWARWTARPEHGQAQAGSTLAWLASRLAPAEGRAGARQAAGQAVARFAPAAVAMPTAHPGHTAEVAPPRESRSDLAQWTPGSAVEWADRMRRETIRCHRSGRRASVVVLRLEGLDALGAAAGPVPPVWLCRVVGAYLRACAHRKDLVQDDHRGSFRVLLVDTTEAGARSYVESVTRLLVPRLDDPRADVRLNAGWAGSCSQPDLEAAYRLAQARLAGASEGWIRSASVWRS